jgi:hypothetical protein
MKKSLTNTNITGRDNYIIAKALIYAIAEIQSLPSEKQEYSDMMDMCDIANKFWPDFLAILEREVLIHTGKPVNLNPEE